MIGTANVPLAQAKPDPDDMILTFLHSTVELFNKLKPLPATELRTEIEQYCKKVGFKLDNLFSTSGTNGELGTGIGLKLCKTLVEKHNGTLLIHSEIHKGTTCVFTLPI